MSGFTDLHCHLLYGLDDGPETVDESLAMAKLLVELGFSHVAPSPHARPDFAPREQALERLAEVQRLLREARIPLELAVNAENYLLDDRFISDIGTPAARKLGQGAYVLVEAPYNQPVPALTEMIFRMKLKGVTPLLAHPERCLEFERNGRAAEAVRSGACLQLDVGSLTGRYGPNAKRMAREFLDDGLYAVAATDLHSPTAAEWVALSLDELAARAGEAGTLALLRDNPAKVLRGEELEPA